MEYRYKPSGVKNTSCPDQLAKALEEIKQKGTKGTERLFQK